MRNHNSRNSSAQIRSSTLPVRAAMAARFRSAVSRSPMPRDDQMPTIPHIYSRPEDGEENSGGSVSKLPVDGERIAHPDEIHTVIIVIQPGVGDMGHEQEKAVRPNPVSEIERLAKQNR